MGRVCGGLCSQSEEQRRECLSHKFKDERKQNLGSKPKRAQCIVPLHKQKRVEASRREVPGKHDWLGVAGGFDEVDSGEGQGAAEEFDGGAAFTEEEDAEESGGNWEEIVVGGELRDFEIAE